MLLIQFKSCGHHQVLVKYEIAEKTNERSENGVLAEKLELTKQSENRETIRLFQLLYEKFKLENQIFDPLGIFDV